MRFKETEDCSCLFCGGSDRVQVVARNDGAAAFAVCAACRGKIVAAWSSDVLPEMVEQIKQDYSEATNHVMAEAAKMSEEQFEEKYLSDIVDRVIFEYVRGYGQTDLSGGAMGLLSIMTEQNAEVVQTHIDGLEKRGLLYHIAGSPGWYGADYPFADD